MRVSSLQMHDAYVWGVVEHLCTKIRAHFPEATFDVCVHPTQRGAIIDAHVATDDAFAVLDLVNPALEELLLDEGIAVSVRVLGPSSEAGMPRGSGAGRSGGNLSVTTTRRTAPALR
jgi:hypothetical protein